MNYVLTNEQMRAADRYTIEGGVPALELMEGAGIALADEAEKLAKEGKILCLCGGGNNGGDGFVCARILKERGREVDLVCYAEKKSTECERNEARWQSVGGEIREKIPQAEYVVAVDCLYGTGFHGVLSGKDEEAVLELNERKKSGVKILAADIPSGLDGRTGCAQGVAARADVTLCIGEIKRCVLFGDGIDYAGELRRADIGIRLPDEGYPTLIDGRGARALLPERKRNSHKGTYGKAAIVGGSAEYTGAAYLSAAACLRSGVGYTTLFVPKELLPHYLLKAPELLLKASNEGSRYAFNEENMRELLGCDAVAFGMGMGVSKEVFQGVEWLLENYEGKLIIDADGLNSLSTLGKGELVALFAKKKCEVLLTPHVKEFSRLSDLTVAEILEDSVAASRSFAKECGVTVLLKNAVSVITDGTRVTLNAAGSSGQAKGGSGDVLAGMLVGLCASGMPVFEGGVLGAYLVGYSAQLAQKRVGTYAMTASDFIECLQKSVFLTELGISEDADENSDQE